MAFRRDEQEREFSIWRRDFNELIVAAGVPDFIIESRKSWLNFLDNGYLEEQGPSRHFDYDVRALPVEEQETLLQLIETYPDGTKSGAAQRLRQLLKSAN